MLSVPKTVVIGLISTTAMTVAMQFLYKELPPNEQYPLPPEEIATVAEIKVCGVRLNNAQHIVWTYLSHYGYGMILAVIYSRLAKRLPFTAAINGISYGLTVWTISYLGWLPAFHVLRSATKFPSARRTLMIVAHIVWGMVLGLLTDKFQNSGINQ
jgi:uncharacterized membrane protein YagU involved in acid resistance